MSLTILLSMIWGGIAQAGGGKEDESTGGSRDGQTIESHVEFDDSSNHYGGKSGGQLMPAGSWKPPACWYEPFLRPEAMAAWAQRTWWDSNAIGTAFKARQRDYYVNGKPYKDFNAGQAGLWWSAVGNHTGAGAAEVDACMAKNSRFLWVPAGAPVPAAANLSAETLAGLAYGRLRVPDTSASVSPVARQTVNLPAWVWLDRAVFRPYSVTASLPAVGLSATTMATPAGLRIMPGTPHADLFPAGGSCALSGGRVGVPYTKGVKGDPPCGVVYRRASTAGPYRFVVSVTWEVSWTGSDGTGGDLGEATFEGPVQNMTVQEIQAIVTRGE